MENKIGEIITLPDGRKAEVVEVSIENGCEGCIFNCYSDSEDMADIVDACAPPLRSDHKNIIYKEIKD